MAHFKLLRPNPLQQHFHFLQSSDSIVRVRIEYYSIALSSATNAIRKWNTEDTDGLNEYLQNGVSISARFAKFFLICDDLELYYAEVFKKTKHLKTFVKIQQKNNNVHGFPGCLEHVFGLYCNGNENIVQESLARSILIQVSDSLGPQKKLIFLSNMQGNPQMDLQDQGVVDSGCSRHMTGNISYLTNYEEIHG
ncbi:hypothetical protein Tco_1338351 [Tanacetum coccineum]